MDIITNKLNYIKDNNFKKFVNISKDYVYSQGILMRKPDNPSNPDQIQHAPYTLFPSPFCKKSFDLALEIQPDINLLMYKISYDHKFLEECLKDVIKVDDFTRNIWNIYEQVYNEGFKQSIFLAIIRTDYMMHIGHMAENSRMGVKQVEINTISASFASLAQKLNYYHRFILNETEYGDTLLKNIPENTALDGIAQSLVQAWKLYSSKSAVILILTQDDDRNIYDQRFLEFAAKKINPKIKFIRRSLESVSKNAILDNNFNLIIENMEVALVYQRSCYTPNDFDFNGSWQCRLMIERSRAIKCPTAAFQLAGTKKVQQILSQPGVLEKFLDNPATISKIRSTFADQYSFDMGATGDRSIDLALSKPEDFVVKPQREGGGNNTYGTDIIPLLTRIRNSDERLSYILMQRINPPVIRNLPISANKEVDMNLVPMISELGVYAYIIGTSEKVIENRQQGFLLRTKKMGVNEGGVATGYSSLDTPLLIDL